MTPELLAPAGSRESLEAAARCGANAVYLGGKGFNARQNADNFDETQLRAAVSYCHIRGIKVYLTLNTLVFDSQLPGLLAALEGACAWGVDGVLVQDLAVARLVRERCPALPLHASTQMSIHDGAGATLLEELGFVRVVLARELSREEIIAVKESTSLQLECFVHGALCFCVSGQCYLSGMIGGRSGNRGRCAQPCRLPMAAGDTAYALSLKDLSLIPQVRELADIGVASLKIEGRMKRPEYVAAAVTACRQALSGEQPDYAALEAVFSRAGFTSGYYHGRLGDGMLGVRRKEDVESAAPVLKGLRKLYKDEGQWVPVAFALTLERGKPASLTVSDGEGNTATATTDPPQEAHASPTDAAKSAAALKKTGGTPYTVGNIQCEIDDGLMIPASRLNALRRDALEGLSSLRGREKPHPYDGAQSLPDHSPYRSPQPPRLRVRLARTAQCTPALAERAEQLVLPAQEFAGLAPQLVAGYSHKLAVEIPGIIFNQKDKLDQILQSVKQCGVTHATAGGLGGIAIARSHGFIIHGDYGLNVTNTLALEEYARLGLTDVTVSFELSLPRIRGLGGSLPRGMLAWGHLPLMVSRNCPIGCCEACGRDFPEVTDRLGNRFLVGCDWQVSRLYNCVPLFLADRLEELPRVDFLTLYFTRESPSQCVRLLALYQDGGSWDGEKTRGLYYRKVQ